MGKAAQPCVDFDLCHKLAAVCGNGGDVWM